MNGEYLLDTNVIIALFNGEPAVVDRLEESVVALIPATVMGELYYGARRSARAELNLARVDALAALRGVLGCDGETAR